MKLFYNGFFTTMINEGDVAQALSVNEEGIIEKVFYELPVNFKGERIDLKGGHVYPGFVDTHTHSFEGGLYSVSANLADVRSLNELFEIVSSTKPIGGLIFAYNFDENKIKEKRFPTVSELNSLIPNIPCLLRRIDGHSAVTNSIAIEKSGILIDNSKQFDGIFRGVLNDKICHWFHRNINEEGILHAFSNAAVIALKNGHTTIHTMVGDADSDPLYYELINRHKNDFPVDFVLYPQIFNVQKALQLQSKVIGGCILVDGSFGSGTAAIFEPYHNDKENKGILYRNDQEWYQFVKEAHRNDLQVAAHAIGDRAINQIVNIYAKVQKENPKPVRHQVIHNELITDEQIMITMKDFNIAAVMQPEFDRLWGGENGFYANVLGKERALQCNRLKSLISARVLVTGSSDWYVTELNALKGIASAVNLHNKAERLSCYEAIELYTSNAAKLNHNGEKVGRFASGMKADFVSLNEDIMNSGNISEIQVLAVAKEGKIVLSNENTD